jgi:DNA-binding CsgD family transcriptional regulator
MESDRARKPANVVPCEAAGMVDALHPLAGSSMLNDEAWAEVARALHLSGREVQTVRGVFDNDKEAAIAANLGIAFGTVHTHMERLFRKLSVTTRVELVLRVMETFLMDEASHAHSRPAANRGQFTPLSGSTPPPSPPHAPGGRSDVG